MYKSNAEENDGPEEVEIEPEKIQTTDERVGKIYLKETQHNRYKENTR